MLVWLLGVYSNRLGTSQIPVDGLRWVSGSALAFALAGLLFGSHAGTLVGKAITAIFEFERNDEGSSSEWHAPQWLVVVVLIGVVIGVWWWLIR